MNEFTEKLINLEKEIIALKTAKKIGIDIDFNIKNFTPTTASDTFKITYKEGSQPIISEVFFQSVGDRSHALTTPSGNIQYIVLTLGGNIQPFTVYSTREIEKIEAI